MWEKSLRSALFPKRASHPEGWPRKGESSGMEGWEKLKAGEMELVFGSHQGG